MHSLCNKIRYYSLFLWEASFKFATIFLLFIIAVIVTVILFIAVAFEYAQDFLRKNCKGVMTWTTY